MNIKYEIKVEKADRPDLLNMLIAKHTRNGAVPVTVNILESMDCNDLATKLKKTFQGEEHFIDVHRTALINRVHNVTAVLDRLLDHKAINPLDYDRILVERINRNRMRKIFSGPINAGGKRAKDVLYEILESQEPYLMDDLKELRR